MRAALESGGPAADHGDALRRRRGPDRVFPLAARGGVDETDDRQAARVHVAASLVAGDAGADLRRPSIPRLCREIRVRVQGTTEGHEVGGARLDHVLGDAGVADAAGDADGHVDMLANLACKRREHTLRHFHRLRDPPVGLVHPGRDIDQVDARRDEVWSDRAHVCQRQAVVLVLVAADSVEDRQCAAHHFADGRDHLEWEAHPSGQVAAVLVVALVAPRRQELAQQVAVCAVNADEVATGLRRAAGRIGKALDDLSDLRAIECARGEPAGPRVGYDGRRAALESADPWLDHAAPVVELGTDDAAMSMDRPDHPREIGHQVVIVQPHLERPPLAPRIDVGRFGVEQPDSAPRAGRHVVDVALRDPSFRRAVVALHRRSDDAVADFQGANPAGFEQARKAHGDVSGSVGQCGTSVDPSAAALSRAPISCGAPRGDVPRSFAISRARPLTESVACG